MNNIDKKALERRNDMCVLEIYDWQWSTLGELLSYSKMQEILKSPDNYYFDFLLGGDGSCYMKIMKFSSLKKFLRNKDNIDVIKVISSTGKVHGADKVGNKYQTVCNHANGPTYSLDMLKDWKETNKDITCKNCIRILSKES